MSHSIALPASPAPPRRPPIPIVAALVPVAAGVVLWMVTGSVLSLCFALLGPLMIAGSFLDGIRQRRRETKRLAAEAETAWAQVAHDLEEVHCDETARLWRRHPDVAHCMTAEPLHEDREVDASTAVTVGRGERSSTIRISGGDGERARHVRRRAATLTDAPIVIALGRGMCIRAPRVVGTAVARAIIAQLCLRFLPGRLTLIGPVPDDAIFAHARSVTRGSWRVAIVPGEPTRIPVADAAIWVCDENSPVPDGITTVIDGADPAQMTLRTPEGLQTIAVECLSAEQFTAIGGSTVGRGAGEALLPDRVRLADLPEDADCEGLRAVIGRRADDIAEVDLVGDGPHAIVTGMTGVGKSELLVSWVAAMAAIHSPEEVVFVLADFKGGTAFDPLTVLPHVTAVITDLDEGGARRGVESLTAELRRRERILAEVGARDIDDPTVRMPRLVIVVDEFAALLHEHPDLGAVFTDIAARGRALGMHLILGTQRASGVIRDALAANCPLRISLRVAEAADSRMVIGSDAAAELEGGRHSRGIAFVRRPQDMEAVATRVALTDSEDLQTIAGRWAHIERPPGPWLPELPTTLSLGELASAEPASRGSAALVLGLADEPHRQCQPVVRLRPRRERGLSVVGGPGSGKSSLLRALRVQTPTAVSLPPQLEQAWDMLDSLVRGSDPAALLLCDDVDRMLAAYPAEYALAFAERFEQYLRAAEGCTVVLTASRAAGPVARLLDALPDRMLLRMTTRGEHLAAGGESASFLRERPPGRGHMAGIEVQVAWTPVDAPHTSPLEPEELGWQPERALVGVLGNGSTKLLSEFRSAFPRRTVLAVGSESPADDSTPRDGVILIGDGESWQRDWVRLQRVRAEGEMLVLAEHAAQLRTLLGVRELPPYALAHRGRAWRLTDGNPPARTILPWHTQ